MTKKTQVKERKVPTSLHKKAGLVLPVTRIRNAMRHQKRGSIKNVGMGAGIAMTCVLEQLMSEVFEGAMNTIKDQNEGHKEPVKSLKPKHLFKSIEEDDELDEMFKDAHFRMEHCGTRHREVHPDLESKANKKKKLEQDNE